MPVTLTTTGFCVIGSTNQSAACLPVGGPLPRPGCLRRTRRNAVRRSDEAPARGCRVLCPGEQSSPASDDRARGGRTTIRSTSLGHRFACRRSAAISTAPVPSAQSMSSQAAVRSTRFATRTRSRGRRSFINSASRNNARGDLEVARRTYFPTITCRRSPLRHRALRGMSGSIGSSRGPPPSFHPSRRPHRAGGGRGLRSI